MCASNSYASALNPAVPLCGQPSVDKSYREISATRSGIKKPNLARKRILEEASHELRDAARGQKLAKLGFPRWRGNRQENRASLEEIAGNLCAYRMSHV